MPLHTLRQQIERDFNYILYNLRQSIKHEIDGTNIGEYKDDVQKYIKEAESFISSSLTRYADQYEKSVVEICESKKKEPNTIGGYVYLEARDKGYNEALSDISQSILSIRKTK